MATIRITDMITGVEDIIGYNFADPLILWEALQGSGSGNTFAGTRRFPEGNKRLAILGDTILQLVLVRDWYHTARVRGVFSDIIRQVGSNANLDRVGRLHGLDEFICASPAQAGYISPTTMSDTVEAVLGAVYLDGGINNVSHVMQSLGLVAP